MLTESSGGAVAPARAGRAAFWLSLLGFLLWAAAAGAAFWAQYHLTVLRQLERGGWLYALAAALGVAGIFLIDRDAPLAPEPAEPDDLPPWRWLSMPTFLSTVLLLGGIAAVAFSVYRLLPPISYEQSLDAWVGGLILAALAAVVGTRRPPRRAGGRLGVGSWELALILILLVVAIAYRLPHLEAIPPEVHGDEAACGLEARRILHGEVPNLFSVGWYHIPYASFAISAASMWLFGDDLWGFRMASVIQGTLSVLLLYGIAKRLFSRRVAFMSAFFVAVSHWHVHFSRSGINYMQAVFATLLVFYFLVRGIQERRALHWLLAGFAAGLCVNVYYSARLAPVLAALYLLHRCIFERGFLRRQWLGILAMGLGAVLFLAPMGVVFSQYPKVLLTRTEGVFLLSPNNLHHAYYTYRVDTTREVLREQFERTVLALHVRGETSLQHNHKAPLVDLWSGALLVVGLAAFGLRFHRSRFFLVASWFWLTMLLGSMLTIDALFSPRVIAVIPALFMFPALVADAGWRAAERLTGRFGRYAFVLPVLALLALSAWANYLDYFELHIHHLQSAGINTTLSRYVEQINDEYQIYLIGPISLRYDTERFLIPDVDGVDVGTDELPLPLQRIPANKGVAFLVAYAQGDALQRLQEVQSAYPGGETTILKTPIGIPVFHVHLVEQAELAAAAPQAVRDSEPVPGSPLGQMLARGRLRSVPRRREAPRRPAPRAAAPPRRRGPAPWLDVPEMTQLLDVAAGRDGQVYVVDRVLREVLRFDADGKRLGVIPPSGAERLVDPRALEIGPQGNLFVLDSVRTEVPVYAPDGTPVRKITLPGGYFPSSLAVDPTGAVLVADTGRSRVVRVGPDGALSTVGRTGDPKGLIDQPTDVAVTAEGEILVADGVNTRVVVYGPDLAYRREWALPPAPVFPGYRLLVVGPKVFVSQPEQGRVLLYRLDGEKLDELGDGTLTRPVGLALDAHGMLLVADMEARGVFRFDVAAE